MNIEDIVYGIKRISYILLGIIYTSIVAGFAPALMYISGFRNWFILIPIFVIVAIMITAVLGGFFYSEDTIF